MAYLRRGEDRLKARTDAGRRWQSARGDQGRAYHYTDQNQLAFVLDHLTPGRSVRYEYNAAGDTTARIIGELAPDGTVVDSMPRRWRSPGTPPKACGRFGGSLRPPAASRPATS